MKTIEELFSYNNTLSNIKTFYNDIVKKYNKENGYNSIPKEYYPYLYKLLSYRKYDSRGNYNDGDIKTFFVGNADYENKAIMFFDKDNCCDCIGITNAMKAWQEEKNNWFKEYKRRIETVCRNIVKPQIEEFRDNITFPIKDEITGELIYNKNELHIDHYDKDFSEVLFDWLYLLKKEYEKRNKKLCDICYILQQYINEKDLTKFEHEGLNKSFYNYHKTHTHLRPVSQKTNLSREKIKMNWDLLKINGCYIEKYMNEKQNEEKFDK